MTKEWWKAFGPMIGLFIANVLDFCLTLWWSTLVVGWLYYALDAPKPWPREGVITDILLLMILWKMRGAARVRDRTNKLLEELISK